MFSRQALPFFPPPSKHRQQSQTPGNQTRKDTERYLGLTLCSEIFHHPQCLSAQSQKHISVCVSTSGGPPPPRPDTIVAVAGPPCASVSGRAAKKPLPPPLPPAAHLARLSLSLWQCPPPLTAVTVILAGSSLRAGASHGGSRFLNYGPDVWGRMGTQRGEGNYALTSFPLSLGGVSHLHPGLKSALETDKMALESLHGRWRGLGEQSSMWVPSAQSRFLGRCCKISKNPSDRWLTHTIRKCGVSLEIDALRPAPYFSSYSLP